MNNQEISFSLTDLLLLSSISECIDNIKKNNYAQAIAFINNLENNDVRRNICLNAIKNKIFTEVNKSLENSNPNYEDCYNKINLLRKINHISNDFESHLLNMNGVINYS